MLNRASSCRVATISWRQSMCDSCFSNPFHDNYTRSTGNGVHVAGHEDDLHAAHLIRSRFTLCRAGIRAEVRWPQRRVSCHRGRVLLPGNRGRYGAPNDSKRHPLQELSRPLASGRKLNALASALARDMFRNRHSLRPAPWSDTAPQIDLSLRLADFLHQFPAPGCRLRSQDGSSGETVPG